MKYLSLFLVMFFGCPNVSLAQADLSLLNLEGIPNEINPGEVVNYTFDIRNAGFDAVFGNYVIKTYLSIDRYSEEDDIEVDYMSTGNTPIGIEKVSGEFIIPESFSSTYATLIIVIDADEQIGEINELNNELSKGISIKIEYQEVDCQQNLGYLHSFLCQNNIEEGYEIYTKKSGTIYKHIVDYDGNILSTDVHEVITELHVNNDVRQLEERDLSGNVISSTQLPDYLFDDHPQLQVKQLVTGEYVFYYNVKTYPNTIGFSSRVIIIKTTSSFEQIDIYDDILNETSNAPNDAIEGVIPTQDGGFYVDYRFNLGTWQGMFYSYLVKYDADGKYNLLHHEEASSFKFEETPCGLKRIEGYHYGSIYSGVNNVQTFWNNNASTHSTNNESSAREAYQIQQSFQNTNVRSTWHSTNYEEFIPYTIYVTDGEEEYEYLDTGFNGYLLKGTGPTFLAFKTINNYLTISQYPCDPDNGNNPEPEDECAVNTEEIESLDFTNIGSFGNSEYFVSNNPDNMYSIEALLDEYEYQLACIESEEENDFLIQHLTAMTYIGLNDAGQENVLSWATGETLDYINFDNDCSFCHTNNQLNDHVIMNFWNGKWSWTNAWSNRPYIIEVACNPESNNPKPSLRMVKESRSSEHSELEAFTIYPNPSTDFINVSFDSKQDQEVTLAIYDGLGAKIHEQVEANAAANGSVQINVSNFPTGVYFVHLFDESHRAIKKFVKQ